MAPVPNQSASAPAAEQAEQDGGLASATSPQGSFRPVNTGVLAIAGAAVLGFLSSAAPAPAPEKSEQLSAGNEPPKAGLVVPQETNAGLKDATLPAQPKSNRWVLLEPTKPGIVPPSRYVETEFVPEMKAGEVAWGVSGQQLTVKLPEVPKDAELFLIAIDQTGQRHKLDSNAGSGNPHFYFILPGDVTVSKIGFEFKAPVNLKGDSAAATVLAAQQGLKVLPFAEDGQPFPNWSLKSMNGVDLNSEKFKGKVVIFDFWASYCGPCVNIATPNIHALQKSYPNDVVVVAINVDGALTQKKGLQLIDKWQGEGRYNLMFDGNSEQFALFGRALRGAPINGIPLVVVVDKDQTVRHIGSMLDKAEIDKVTGLLKPQQITQSTPSATPGR